MATASIEGPSSIFPHHMLVSSKGASQTGRLVTKALRLCTRLALYRSPAIRGLMDTLASLCRRWDFMRRRLWMHQPRSLGALGAATAISLFAVGCGEPA